MTLKTIAALAPYLLPRFQLTPERNMVVMPGVKAVIKNDHGVDVPKVMVQGRVVDPNKDPRFSVVVTGG